MKSNYLCKCKNLLYLDLDKREYCLNKNCENYGPIKKIKNEYEPAEKQFKGLSSRIKFKSVKFNLNFKKFLFGEQNKIISKLFTEGKIHVEDFLYISYLIFLTKNINFVGRDGNMSHFQRFLIENRKTFDIYSFFQNMKEEIYTLVSTDKEGNLTLTLKYIEAIREQQKEYGLVMEGDSKDSFKYEKIGVVNIKRIPFSIGMDFEEYFKNFFTLMIQIDMITKMNKLFSDLFEREFDKYPIVGLLSLFYSAKTMEGLNIITKKELKITLEKMKFPKEKIKEFFTFILGGENKIPFVLDNGAEILYSKGVLFVMALKFMSHLKEKPIVNELKSDIGFVFEDKLREKLKEKGYLIPFKKGFKLFKKSFDYDIVAINPIEKKILIMEAKFRDLPCSAFSGKNILNLKLNDKDSGEIPIAERQERRRKELSKNLDIFEKRCKEEGLDLDLNGFDIEALAIFKFTPILFNHGYVRLMSFNKMIEEL
ncbi:MAG: hypothetical protein PVJ67_06555 [Candidatus Pacearchaeota archaeon]|jgi:hypothetical protein